MERDVTKIEELQKFAAESQAEIAAPALVLLEGNLGAGKTTFVKHFGAEAGVLPRLIKSPTFSLINRYQGPDFTINHIDLYRLEHPDRSMLQEIRELLADSDAITFVEWGERLPDLTAEIEQINVYKIKLTLEQASIRKLHFQKLA